MQTQLQQRSRAQRVAIVHDWLVVNGGAEKVLEALASAFPQAEIFTLVNFMPAGVAPGCRNIPCTPAACSVCRWRDAIIATTYR